MTTRTNFAWLALAFAGIAGAALPAPAQTPPVVSDTEPPPPPPDEEALPSQPPPTEAQPPAQAPDLGTFKQQLSPYGRWVDTPEYGRVWIPSGVRSDWQPYTDGRCSSGPPPGCRGASPTDLSAGPPSGPRDSSTGRAGPAGWWCPRRTSPIPLPGR